MATSWGAVCRPKSGQTVSGDAYVVVPFGTDGLQIAVIDGLGGGTEAARAAEGAAAIIRAHPELDPLDLIRRSHTELHNTRGAVIALFTLNTRLRTATYVGVGNIGIQAYSRNPIKPISKNGILGYRLPPLLKLNYDYNFGDTFVLYSDGISSRFGLDAQIDSAQPPQALAEVILNQYGKFTDDATVVVVRVNE